MKKDSGPAWGSVFYTIDARTGLPRSAVFPFWHLMRMRSRALAGKVDYSPMREEGGPTNGCP